MNMDKYSKFDLKIESGVPISQRCPRVNHWIEIMKKMKLGDSVILPDGYKRSRGNLSNYALIAGIEITTRRQMDGKVRMWRIR